MVFKSELGLDTWSPLPYVPNFNANIAWHVTNTKKLAERKENKASRTEQLMPCLTAHLHSVVVGRAEDLVSDGGWSQNILSRRGNCLVIVLLSRLLCGRFGYGHRWLEGWLARMVSL